MQPAPMPKDICCENFKGLLAYIQNHYGVNGVHQLTEGLMDGAYCVRDKFSPDQIIPMRLDHLIDPAYRVSNAFSLALLDNVKKLVPGPNPLYTAGYDMVRESLSRTTLFAAKLGGTRRLAGRAARINARFNRTQDVHLAEITKTSQIFELNYRSGYEVTKDVCNWNRGIYSGIASLTGVTDVIGRDKMPSGPPATRKPTGSARPSRWAPVAIFRNPIPSRNSGSPSASNWIATVRHPEKEPIA